MSIDTVFKPAAPLTLVGVTAVQPCPGQNGTGIYTFHVRCLATAYLTWGRNAAVVAAGAPAAGVPSPNTVGMTIGGVETFEIPGDSFFISTVAASFELIGGSGA
jgi:hypothetical protein